jgi:hypothetical protein
MKFWTMPRYFRFCTVLCLWLVALTANADAEPCLAFYESAMKGKPADALYALLNTQRARGCILGPTDTTGIEPLYQAMAGEDITDVQRAAMRAELIGKLLNSFDGVAPCADTGSDSVACVAGRHLGNIDKAARMLNGDLPRDETFLSLSGWTVVIADGKIAVSDIVVRDFLMRECVGGSAAMACRTAAELAAKFMRTSLAMVQLIAQYNRPLIDANAAFLSRSDREWDQYFNAASVQYPWELAWNSRRYSKKHGDDRDKFLPAPTDKVIFLHPALGYEHIDTPLENGRLVPALALEIFGYEKWRYRDGKAENRWGASIVASFVDIQGMDTLAYGLMVHTPLKNISIGAVSRDGDAGKQTGIVISVDLAKLLQQYENADIGDFLSK